MHEGGTNLSNQFKICIMYTFLEKMFRMAIFESFIQWFKILFYLYSNSSGCESNVCVWLPVESITHRNLQTYFVGWEISRNSHNNLYCLTILELFVIIFKCFLSITNNNFPPLISIWGQCFVTINFNSATSLNYFIIFIFIL